MNHLLLVLLSLAGIALTATEAYAYVDPGTGSFLIQVVLGTLLGLAFAFKKAIKDALAYLGKLFGKSRADE